MVKTIVRENKWPPDVIGGLFVDDLELNGLEYYYNDIIEVHAEMDRIAKKNKKAS